MSGIYGILNIAHDSNRVWLSTIGQSVIYDAVKELVDQWNVDMDKMLSLFIEKKTFDHKVRCLLPGGGRPQMMGLKGPAGAVKRTGYNDEHLPLIQWGMEIGGSRVQQGYMDLETFDAHLDNVFTQDVNEMRWQLMHRMLDDGGGASENYDDQQWGTLTVNPGANGDARTYAPVAGSATEAIEDHYLESGYTVATISTANMPVKTIRDDLLHHYGGLNTGGDPVVILTTSTIGDKLKTICGAAGTWNDVPDFGIRVSEDTDVVGGGLPNAPGYCIGRVHSAWIFVWEWIPATYMVGTVLTAKPFAQMRVDPDYTGLGQGLVLAAQDTDHPLWRMSFERRCGIGGVNRLNLVVMEVADGGTYSIPAAFD